MKKWLIAYSIGAILTFPMNLGWLYAYPQGRWPRIAQRDCARDHGMAIIQAAISAPLWPVMTPFNYAYTGYAQFGHRIALTCSHDGDK